MNQNNMVLQLTREESGSRSMYAQEFRISKSIISNPQENNRLSNNCHGVK